MVDAVDINKVSGVPDVGTPPAGAQQFIDTMSNMRGSGPMGHMMKGLGQKMSDRFQYGDPDELLENMLDDRFASFNQYYKPLIGSLEEESTSTELVDSAIDRAGELNRESIEQTQRSIERTGASLTPAQRRQLERSRQHNVAIAEASTVNSARSAQQGIREGATNDLMTTASALQSGSTQALTTISQNKYRRDQQYEQAKSGLYSNILSTGGAVLGGIYGGPAGAAAGAAAGSTVGSMI